MIYSSIYNITMRSKHMMIGFAIIYTCNKVSIHRLHIPWVLVFLPLLEIISVDREVTGNEHFQDHSFHSARNRNHTDLVSFQNISTSIILRGKMNSQMIFIHSPVYPPRNFPFNQTCTRTCSSLASLSSIYFIHLNCASLRRFSRRRWWWWWRWWSSERRRRWRLDLLLLHRFMLAWKENRVHSLFYTFFLPLMLLSSQSFVLSWVDAWLCSPTHSTKSLSTNRPPATCLNRSRIPRGGAKGI